MRQDIDPIKLGRRLSRNWWTLVLRGAIAVLFGLFALFLPGITLTSLVFLFGAFALGGGILLIISAFRDRVRGASGWVLLLNGVISVAIGVLAFIYPGLTALSLLYLIAAWAVVTGIFEIIAAIQLREEISTEWLLAIAGIASIAFGILLAVYPGAGALALVWIIAGYALFFGILLMILGFRLRNWRGQE
ncbi:HdeD family acid-resistance protein [Myxacorys almedinensis]|uniref:HdeD family acid-resistance protein n=1 Tax=Myxacorys almedinensis A TaxID=2690445 RepID=A0A8J7Z4Q8_9CYAN|nr:HdeD family acid-resistance protein [Myxacorys almedinensis]NDJ18136.1 HdeD family acid-resistance protein [Myxacorys almedinensis A]